MKHARKIVLGTWDAILIVGFFILIVVIAISISANQAAKKTIAAINKQKVEEVRDKQIQEIIQTKMFEARETIGFKQSKS